MMLKLLLVYPRIVFTAQTAGAFQLSHISPGCYTNTAESKIDGCSLLLLPASHSNSQVHSDSRACTYVHICSVVECLISSCGISVCLCAFFIRGLQKEELVLLTHGDSVDKVADGFKVVAQSGNIIAGEQHVK